MDPMATLVDLAERHIGINAQQRDAVRWALDQLRSAPERLPDSPLNRARIQAQAAAREAGVDWGVFTTRSNASECVDGRRIVWRRLRELGWAFSKIARVTGRNHTTVMYALGRTSKNKEPADAK
jgi:chromosomal replication initiation ATPase DnaA